MIIYKLRIPVSCMLAFLDICGLVLFYWNLIKQIKVKCYEDCTLYTYPNQSKKEKIKSECYTKLDILGKLFNTSVYNNDYTSTHLQRVILLKI